MKAVVLEIKNGKAAVLTKDGSIIRIKNDGYNIGSEISISESRDNAVNFRRFAPFVSAAAALLIFIGSGSYVYSRPYGTVSLDVNPSIEYTINRFDRVLNVYGVNNDGAQILNEIDKKELINKDIETAVANTVMQIGSDGYLSYDDGNYVVVTANTKDEDRTELIVSKLDDKIAEYGDVTPIAMKATDEELNEAHRQGISVGKMKMVNRLSEASDNEIDRTQWNDRSVADIMREYDRLQDRQTPDKNAQHDKGESNTSPSNNTNITGSDNPVTNEEPAMPDIMAPSDNNTPPDDGNRDTDNNPPDIPQGDIPDKPQDNVPDMPQDNAPDKPQNSGPGMPQGDAPDIPR